MGEAERIASVARTGEGLTYDDLKKRYDTWLSEVQRLEAEYGPAFIENVSRGGGDADPVVERQQVAREPEGGLVSPQGHRVHYDPESDSFTVYADAGGGRQTWGVTRGGGVQNLGFEAPQSRWVQFRDAAKGPAAFAAAVAAMAAGIPYVPGAETAAATAAGAAGAAEGVVGGTTFGANLASMPTYLGTGSGALGPAGSALVSTGGLDAAALLGPAGAGWSTGAGGIAGTAMDSFGTFPGMEGVQTGSNWLQNAKQGIGTLNKVRQGINAIRGLSGSGRSGGSGGGIGGIGGGGGGGSDVLAAPNMQNYNPTGKFVDPYAVAPVNRAPAQDFGVASLRPQFQEPQQESQQSDDETRFFATGGMPNMGMGGIAPIHYAAGGEYAAGGRYIRGPGDGMSDDIKANIDGTQEARLANSEFVLPADVVSHIGNGSSEAGAKKLYAMMDRNRHARTGNHKQGKQINPDKFLPA